MIAGTLQARYRERAQAVADLFLERQHRGDGELKPLDDKLEMYADIIDYLETGMLRVRKGEADASPQNPR